MDQLKSLGKRLRQAHGRTKDIAARQQREMRGKADPHGAGPAQDNTGSMAKVQVLFEAIQRLDAELSRREEADTAHPSQADLSRCALEVKLSGQTEHHPNSGRAASEGKQMKERKTPAKIGTPGRKSAVSLKRIKWRRPARMPRGDLSVVIYQLPLARPPGTLLYRTKLTESKNVHASPATHCKTHSSYIGKQVFRLLSRRPTHIEAAETQVFEMWCVYRSRRGCLLRKKGPDQPSTLYILPLAPSQRTAQKIEFAAMSWRASSRGTTVFPNGPNGVQACFPKDQ